MNTSQKYTVLSITLFALSLPSALPQGSLTPTGAPTPTMKSLSQVEARTVIDQSQPGFTLPYTISQPGSYYLARNLTASGTNGGIVISADNVNLDLNGFALIGNGTGTAIGISVPAARKNVTIRNGAVQNWTGGGVVATQATNSIIEKLHVTGCNGGILVVAIGVGANSLMKDCVSSNNAGLTNGFSAGSGATIIGCVASSNGNNGFLLSSSTTISACTAYGNSNFGIVLQGDGVIEHCTASHNASAGISGNDGIMISDCAATSNGGVGIQGGSGSVIRSCSVTSNTGNGITTGAGSTVSECSSSTNSGNGIDAGLGSAVRSCTFRSNVLNGIVVEQDSYIVGNVASANNTSGSGNSGGIIANVAGTNGTSRIDSNHAPANTGYGLANGGQFVIRNTAKSNTSNDLNNVLAYSGVNSMEGEQHFPWLNFTY